MKLQGFASFKSLKTTALGKMLLSFWLCKLAFAGVNVVYNHFLDSKDERLELSQV